MMKLIQPQVSPGSVLPGTCSRNGAGENLVRLRTVK